MSISKVVYIKRLICRTLYYWKYFFVTETSQKWLLSKIQSILFKHPTSQIHRNVTKTGSVMIRCIQWTTESVWCCYKSTKMHNWHHQCFNLIDKNCNILKIQLSSYVWLYSWRIFFISDSVIIFIEYSIYVFALDKSNNFCSPKWKTIDNEHSISDDLSQKSDSSFLTISDMMAVGPRVTSFDVPNNVYRKTPIKLE